MKPQVRVSGHAVSSLGGLVARDGGGDFERLRREAERTLARLEVLGDFDCRSQHIHSCAGCLLPSESAHRPPGLGRIIDFLVDTIEAN